LYHPIFAARTFERASCDRYVLCVAADDPVFEADVVRAIMQRQGAEHVARVPIG
jgi:CTP:molybdopterin cytidylyltransferase MocA